MSKERRQLEDWEKAECAALKAELEAFNAALPRDKRLTQEGLAHELGMSQGTLSSHLNGHRAINIEMAAAISRLISIPVDKFSRRLSDDIENLSGSISRPAAEQESTVHSLSAAASVARKLAVAASPRTRGALEKIAEAADSGMLSEEDVLLLEVIASRLASQGMVKTESPHQRLRKKLNSNDQGPQ